MLLDWSAATVRWEHAWFWGLLKRKYGLVEVKQAASSTYIGVFAWISSVLKDFLVSGTQVFPR